MKIALLFVLAAILMGMTGCTTTGDNPDIYWQERMGNTPALVTPAGEFPTSH